VIAVMAEPVSVLVCGERRAVATLADGAFRHRVVGRVASPASAVLAIRTRRPDVVVAELAELGHIDRLAPLLGEASTVVVGSVPAAFALLPCLAAGARGFVLEPADAETIDYAVAAVAAGGIYVDPRCIDVLVRLAVDGRMARIGEGLTLRQIQVLQLAEEELTNREIASSLGISSETVKSHLHQAMRRLGVHGRLAAAARAVRRPQ